MAINSDQDIVTARQKGRALAIELGFSSGDATLIATSISELARNIVSYAGEGRNHIESGSWLEPPGNLDRRFRSTALEFWIFVKPCEMDSRRREALGWDCRECGV